MRPIVKSSCPKRGVPRRAFLVRTGESGGEVGVCGGSERLEEATSVSGASRDGPPRAHTPTLPGDDRL